MDFIIIKLTHSPNKESGKINLQFEMCSNLEFQFFIDENVIIDFTCSFNRIPFNIIHFNPNDDSTPTEKKKTDTIS